LLSSHYFHARECRGNEGAVLGAIDSRVIKPSRGEWVVIEAYSEHWAVVTGASSGIGAEFARRLAARGMHLVLTARRKDLLEELAEELHTRHGTRCEVIDCDLSEAAAPQKLFDEVKKRNLDIELLINNAGFGWVCEVKDVEPNHIRALNELNIQALTELTYLFLPEMVERKHGGIINVASVAAFQPVAYMGAYAAGKAYVLHFSEALWAEVRKKGVTVMALCPGTTETEFFDVAGVPGWLKKQKSQTAGKVVREALKGLEKGKQFVVPGWHNSLLTKLVRIASRKTVVKESMKYFRPSSKKKSK